MTEKNELLLAVKFNKVKIDDQQSIMISITI